MRSAWVALMGALHRDGLADGWLDGHGDCHRSLQIMREPRIGAAALIAALLGKFAALRALLAQDRPLTLLTACTAVIVPGKNAVVCALAMAGLFVPSRGPAFKTVGVATADTNGATNEVLETGALLTPALGK